MAGCQGEHVQVRRLVPAAQHFAHVHRLAVGGVEGPDGDPLGDMVADSLTRAGHFGIAARPQVMHELGSLGPWQISPAAVMEIGRALQVDAMLFAKVLVSRYSEQMRAVPYPEPYVPAFVAFHREGVMRLTVRWKVVEVASGALLATQTFTLQTQRDSPKKWFRGRAEQVQNAKAIVPGVDIDGLAHEAWAQMAQRVTEHLTPHPQTESVFVFADPRLTQSHRALRAARQGDWGEAHAVYEHAVREALRRPNLGRKWKSRALYNQAVALAYQGRYAASLAALEAAQQLWSSELYVRLQMQVRQMQRDSLEVNRQRLAVRHPLGAD